MKHIYKWLVGLLLFLPGSLVIAQDATLDINATCPGSGSCNPFLNDYACKTNIIRTTHGSPSFYALSINNNTIKTIELRGRVRTESNGNASATSEGFTFKYNFIKGHNYKIKIAHIAATTGTETVPNIIAAFTNDPPRKNDNCDVGLHPFYAGESYNDATNIRVTHTATETPIDYTAPKDYSFLWLFSSPIITGELGSLVISIKIVDNGVASDPNCNQDANFNFCDPSKSWNGSADVRAVNPISLACDAFKSSGTPGSGEAFVRRFTAPSITLSPGFVASATDPNGAVRTLKILPSADPCNQALRVATSPISNVQTVISETQLLENINIYPSPSRGLVNINFNSSNLLNAQISVTDQSGRVVYQMRNKVESNVVQLNLEHLSNGVYFIKVNTKDKVAVKKLLISK